jgi:hypothetical protein
MRYQANATHPAKAVAGATRDRGEAAVRRWGVIVVKGTGTGPS